MVETYGYQGADLARTFDTYDHVDWYNYMDLHDQLKMVKHGYSKVTDNACREIRHGRLIRDDALALVRHYEDQQMRFDALFEEWLGVELGGRRFIMDQHRNPAISQETMPNRFVRRDPLALDRGQGDGYITIGKGFPL